MSILRKYGNTAAIQRREPPPPAPERSPSALLDLISEFIAPEPLRVHAPQDLNPWHLALLTPEQKSCIKAVPRIDDAKGFKRILLGIEDGEGNFHIAFLGQWMPCVLRQLQEAANMDKRLREAAKLRETANEVYKRDYPHACGVEHCQKRFKTHNGLRLHAAAKARHQGDWGSKHAAFLKSLANG